jgi:hypothetical protein
MNISDESKKRRKLFAKDNKIFVFGYWLLHNLPQATPLQEAYMSQFYCDGDVEKQTRAFEVFWSQYKETEKRMNPTKKTKDIKPKDAKPKDAKPKEKKKRGRPRKEKRIVSYVWDNENELLNMLIAEARKEIQGPIHKETEKIETIDDDDEESVCVQRFVHNNNKYLIDSDNNIYDETSHEEIGVFNTKTNIIDFA